MTYRDGYDRIDVTGGFDTDHDGRGDTLPLPSARELLLAVDTDRDGLADMIIEIGPGEVAYSSPLLTSLTDPTADACYADPLDFADPSRW